MVQLRDRVSSTLSGRYADRSLLRMALWAYIEAIQLRSRVSWSTVVCTSVCLILARRCYSLIWNRLMRWRSFYLPKLWLYQQASFLILYRLWFWDRNFKWDAPQPRNNMEAHWTAPKRLLKKKVREVSGKAASSKCWEGRGQPSLSSSSQNSLAE